MFLSRLSKDGIASLEYYSKKWVSELEGLQMPNCTYYAMGRQNELSNLNVKMGECDNPIFNRAGFGNAKDWYNDAHWPVGAMPKVGAVACWGSGSDQYGHVAVVEEVIDNNTIKVSQSNYGGNYFEVKTYNCEVGKVTSGVGYIFNGYIYNPYILDIRTERDETKTQVKVKADSLKARNIEGEWNGLFVPKGIYNVDSFFDRDGYKWAKIGDVIFATNDKDGWTETYTTNASGEITELQELFNRLQQMIDSKDARINLLETKLSQIKSIIGDL